MRHLLNYRLQDEGSRLLLKVKFSITFINKRKSKQTNKQKMITWGYNTPAQSFALLIIGVTPCSFTIHLNCKYSEQSTVDKDTRHTVYIPSQCINHFLMNAPNLISFYTAMFKNEVFRTLHLDYLYWQQIVIST